MAQLFHRSMNTIARASIAAAALGAVVLGWMGSEMYRASYARINEAREQPVQFSHKHHVADDGIDCRYCHTTVETSGFAGIPPTYTCMTCHSQLWTNSPMLQPVLESFQTDASLQWNRVHRLPDFVYFDHSIHVHKGIGCSSCHGRVQDMPLVWPVNTLFMEWCLECHRAPETNVRPRAEVFNMDWTTPRNQAELGKRLTTEYGIRKLTDCYTCHR